MTLFLDQDLKVHWFTLGVKDLFPLMPADAGRRITDLTRLFDDHDFLDDVRAVLEMGLPRDAEVRSVDGRWFMRRIRPYLPGDTSTTGVAITFADITALKDAEAELRRNQASLAGQNEAFQAAMNGEPLEKSLAILVRAAIEQMGHDVRCAFYLADAAGRDVHDVAGMPDHRACWSFPVQTTSKVVGTLAIYHREPRDATERDVARSRRTAGDGRQLTEDLRRHLVRGDRAHALASGDCADLRA